MVHIHCFSLKQLNCVSSFQESAVHIFKNRHQEALLMHITTFSLLEHESHIEKPVSRFIL